MPATSRFSRRVAAHANPVLDREFSQSVTYSRGEKSQSLNVRPFSAMGKNSDGDTQLQMGIGSWSFQLADFQLGEPERGDTITTSSGDVFRVLPAEDGSVWGWANGAKTRYRIDTIREKRS